MECASEKPRVDSGPTSVGGIGDGPTKDRGDCESNNGIPTGGASQTHVLAQMFETHAERLDLAIMKVIAEGGSPSEWIAGMLRQSAQLMEPEAKPEPPRARFLGE